MRTSHTRLHFFVSALGDPLIKGLTEVANTRPSDPIAYLATYLYNYANTSRDIGNSTQVSEMKQKHPLLLQSFESEVPKQLI
jgi:hypothetical protein